MGSILIVDDEPSIRSLLTRIFEASEHTVAKAHDAASALALAAEMRPDVALCDVHMPGANGLWLAARIREVSPDTAIVFATADQMISPLETLRPGVVAYVLKPFRREQVLEAVEEGLRWSAARKKP